MTYRKALLVLVVPLVAVTLVVLIVSGEEGRTGQSTRLENASTIEDARAMVPFDVFLPDASAQDLTFAGARYAPAPSRGPAYSDSALADADVAMFYYQKGDSVRIDLKQSRRQIKAAGTPTPLEVAGVRGEVVYADTSVHVSWTKDGMSYLASSSVSDDWGLPDLVAFVESIP